MNKSILSTCLCLAVVACKGDASKPATAPAPASGAASTSADKPAPAPQPRRDPAFVSVDRDQLAALCLAARLPRTYETPEYGALVLRDGTRVPWLAFTAKEEHDRLVEREPLLAKAWRKSAAEVLPLEDGTASATATSDTLFRPCGSGEANVVVSGMFQQKDGFHLVTVRGQKQLEKLLPPTTPPEEAYATAFTQIEELVGQPAAIAEHRVTEHPTDNSQLTISDDRWKAAAGRD